MALHVPKTAYQNMMKDGSRHYKGLEEAVYRNIDACDEFARITRTSMGPHGRKKIIVNHIQKLFVTNDASTILNELEVQHPAVKIVSMASKMQETETGDASNLVVQFATALLKGAKELLKMGLTPVEVIEGYKHASLLLSDYLKELVCYTVKDVLNKDSVYPIVKMVINSKQYIHSEFLANLITEACIAVKPRKRTDFPIDNVKTVKILGGNVLSSSLVQGLVFLKNVEGSVNEIKNAKIAVYTVGFKLTSTETSGTVLLNTAKELSSYSEGEQETLLNLLNELKTAGVNVVVTSDTVSDGALDYANRMGILVLRLTSKFDIQYLCRASTAHMLPVLRAPTSEEMGHCDHVHVREFGNKPCIVFAQEGEESTTTTIVLRGSSDNLLDELERAVDDGVNAYKMVTLENGYVTGAGSSELALASKFYEYAKTRTDILQYSITKYAEALETVPRILAENSGFNSNEVISLVSAGQSSSKCSFIGIDVDADKPECMNAAENKLYENAYVKKRAMMHATHAANTIISVDQIIMAKPAGGPKMRAPGPMDQD